MFKIIIPIIITTALASIHDGATSKVFAECAASNEGIYSLIISKIENSAIAKSNRLGCMEIIKINENDPNKMQITSGRKRGKYTICLSDNSSNPCKYIIGTFNENKNPSDMLSQVFDIPKPKRTQLNETVERLFFSPSLLID